VTARDAALAAVRGHVDELASALVAWATRDDTKAQPEIRQAANDAMDAIDGALRELHGIRSMVGEIRDSDDAGVAWADELLRRIREERAR
jgi:hypothetical protein